MNPDLTGSWDGIFAYPHGLPSTPFGASLREQAGTIVGETVEEGTGCHARGEKLHALIEGERTGSRVRFTKVYDAYHNHPVLYEGAVNRDATEISGGWHIPGVWSGSFLMVRRGADEADVAHRVSESVER